MSDKIITEHFFFSFFTCFVNIDKICHGCFYKNADGTNKIIVAGEQCLTSTAEYFWKDPNDVKHGVKTRSRANSEPTINF